MLLALEGGRGWSHLSGSFSRKTVKGAQYAYFQYSDPGGSKRQFSIGRCTPALDDIIREYGRERQELEGDLARIGRLSGLLRSAGMAMTPHAPARVLRGLADAGVFSIGGIVCGSYAFQVMGNMLGVRWPQAAWRTTDVDIAGHLKVAVPVVEADIPRALESLQMGFIPVPKLDPRQPSTSFRVRGETLRVDLITPGRKSDEAPVFIPRFKAAAAPLPYLGLVMQDPQPALVVDGGTSTLVVVPDPARFALHKLLVSQLRSVRHQTKSGKDLHQAALVLEALGQDRPDDLRGAAKAFLAAGLTVSRKLARGMAKAVERWPESEVGAQVVRSVVQE